MIELKEVVKFIEKDKNIKLFDFQVRFLDNLIHGKTTRVSRNFGKTMLINGYAKYLNYVHDNGYNEDYQYDDYIGGEEVMAAGLLSKGLLLRNLQDFENTYLETKKKYEQEYCIKIDNLKK